MYGTLAMTSIVTALTMAASMFEMIPEPNGFEVILSFAVIFGVQMSRELVNERWRLGGLLAFGFLQGWQIGPLTRSYFQVDPEIVLSAIIGTVLAFVSFSGVAIFSRRRSHLYLGGLLSFATLFLLGTSLFSVMFNFSLYLGMFIFCFYIIYDTQMIIERVESAGDGVDRLGVDGALQLFTNLIGICVRLMAIIAKLNDGKDKSKEKSKRK